MKAKLLKPAMITWVGMCLGLMLGGTCYGEAKPAQPGGSGKPAVLFSCPGENRYQYVGYDYMRELVKAGFEVDYCEGSAQLTWDRVKKYNVLVVLDFPPRDEKDAGTNFGKYPPWLTDYFAVVERFHKEGGGILFHYSCGIGGLAPNDLLKSWGIQFPVMYIKDPAQTQPMAHMSYPVLLAWTDQVFPSPVSEGVKQIWYPIDRHYSGANTMPILVDDKWRVVVRASKSAATEVAVFRPSDDFIPPKTAVIPAEPIRDPVIYAIRDFPDGGRMAAIQQWHSFSIGSGMKWIYNNEVLSRGLLVNRPSDYGKLLVNTYKWLAEPGVKNGKLGGYVTDMARLTEPQLRPDAMKQFADWVYNEEEVLEYRRPPVHGKLFRGLIGVETERGGGQGSVADYAKVASEKGLDFVVFLEDIAKLTPEKLDALIKDCKANSTSNLTLFAGYKMNSNIGNHMFVFGKNPKLPPPVLLVGPDKATFNMQYQNESGKFEPKNPSLMWCLNCGDESTKSTVGYYDFSHSGNGMAMHDLRPYSMAAIRTYANGKLIDNALDDYFTTVQSTAVPTPVSLNIVRSPEALAQAMDKRPALTYAQARRLELLFDDALRWNCSYDGLNVSLSDGPIIRAWPKCARTLIFGAELFVTGRSLNFAPIHVTSDVGLKEIRIYNGRDLFRRFLFNGTNNFETNLLLSGVVQRGMVLVAEDIKGGQAISFAHRSYKEGTMCPIFCSDHVNDCGWMLLAHGPVGPKFFRAPYIADSIAGFTWDGGPKACQPLCSSEFTRPTLWSDKGEQSGDGCNQMPLLEFSDEGATRCRMVFTETFPEGHPGGNPWSAFGPLIPTPLFDAWASYAEYDQYITGVEPNSYGAIGVWEGPVASLFTEQIAFKKDLTVKQLRLYHSGWRATTLDRSIVLATGVGTNIHEVIDLTKMPDTTRRIGLPTGGWYALFSSQAGNTHLFINRGNPVIINCSQPGAYWLELWADLKNKPVKAGETYDFEMFAMTWPLDMVMRSAGELVKAVAYLENPTGMELKRGKREPGKGGLLEILPENGVVEIKIPKPADGSNRVVPVRAGVFNKRWTVGLYQVEGYRTHYYSKRNSGWREMGLDFDGRAYTPLFAGMAPNTHVVFGHPVMADDAGKDLFIQVTRVTEGDDQTPASWHVSVNNPLDKPVTTSLRKAMDLPGLDLAETAITLQPGEYKVLVESKPAGVTKGQ